MPPARSTARVLTRLATGLIVAGTGFLACTPQVGSGQWSIQVLEAYRADEASPMAGVMEGPASGGVSLNAAALLRESMIPAAARPYARCWRSAGARFGIDPLLLVAIGTVETQLRSNTVHLNTDGSRDLGLMQINTVHLPRLEQRGVTAAMLLESPCVSIMTGAEILAQNVKRHGYNWDAVGAYNAGSRADRHALRMRYAGKVEREYSRLVLSDATPADAQQDASSRVRADVAISLRADPMRLVIRHPAG